MLVRDLFVRSVEKRVANAGVAKVWNRPDLREEIAEYVLTDTIERNLREFLALFVESMGTRGSDQAIQAMAVWCSGFFGSGKSHFVKVLGHLLGNDVVDEATGDTATKLFGSRIPPDSRYRLDIEGYLHQIATRAWCLPIFMEVKAKQDLINPNSVAEICLSAFYETAYGFSPDIRVARHEHFMLRNGIYEDFRALYQETTGTAWEEARTDYYYNQEQIADVLARCGKRFSSTENALTALSGADENVRIAAGGFAEVLFSFLDAKQREHPQRIPHLVFVLDEVQQFIGENNDRIEEVRTIVETLGAMGNGRVWVIATGQEALDRVLDRAGLQLAGLGKLNARFGTPLMLGTEDVQRVVTERLLKKRDAHRPHLVAIWDAHDGYLADLCRLGTERSLPSLNQDSFIAAYPFLPYQPYLAQEIFDSMRGTKLAGTPRSMLDVAHKILNRLADEPCDGVDGQVRLVSLDLVYDEIKDELYNDDYLGSHGVRAVDQADEALKDKDCPVSPTRVLKALWLIQRLNWVPRTAECLTRLLVQHIAEDLHALQGQVEQTLLGLVEGGYVGFDEGTKQYRYLSAEEGEVEKEIVRRTPSGVGDAMRRCKELTREAVLMGRKLAGFSVTHGASATAFSYALEFEGEAVESRLRDFASGDAEGRDMLLLCYGPLTTAKDEEAAQQNVAAGVKGRRAWWFSRPRPEMRKDLRRLIALESITGDPKHATGRSEKYLDAVRDKTSECARLKDRLVRDIEESFRNGTVYAAGENIALDGQRDLRVVVRDVLSNVIAHLYPRFAPADRRIDPARDIEHFLSPSRKPRDAAPELGLFDSADQLILNHELVEPVVDCLKDREDAGEDLDGGSIEAYFEATPFGWPPDLVRTIMAALFRGGAVRVAAGRDFYDFTEPDSHEPFTKTTRFRKAHFHAIKTGLSHTQITEACALLANMGAGHVQQSANHIARAVRKLGSDLLRMAEGARKTAEYGVPLPDTYKTADALCEPVTGEEDPTVVVTQFLALSQRWQELQAFSSALQDFVAAGRDLTFAEIGRLVDICADNPALRRSAQAQAVQHAIEDMAQVRSDCRILQAWSSYEDRARQLEDAYRLTYRAQWEATAGAIAALRSEMQALPELAELQEDTRRPILDAFFGPSGPLGLGDTPDLSSRPALIQATERHSLGALEALQASTPTHREAIIGQLRDALDRQRAEEGQVTVQVKRVAVTRMLRGRRIGTTEDLDAALNEVRTACEAELAPDTQIEME